MEQTPEPGVKKRKKGFWESFVAFLSYGGFILILIVIAAIAIGISALTK